MTDRVLTFGEVMGVLSGPGPLRLGGTLRLSIAGAEANVAIGLARLGHDVAFAGRVGDDEIGRLVTRTLRAESVDVSSVRIDTARPTGMMLRERRVADRARVSYYRAGSAGGAVEAGDVLPALDTAGVVHLTGITAALAPEAAAAVSAVAHAAHDAGAIVCLDVNHRASLWSTTQARSTLRPLLTAVDLLVASEDELSIVADHGDNLPVATVVIKQGARGALVRTREREWHAPARDVPVIDTVGAGDAFVAGYLSALLDGGDPGACLERATTVAAFAVASDGDWEGLPLRSELDLLDTDPGATIR